MRTPKQQHDLHIYIYIDRRRDVHDMAHRAHPLELSYGPAMLEDVVLSCHAGVGLYYAMSCEVPVLGEVVLIRK